ncbi:MAG TPA: YggS family pyridoxal phosphate-dependent enzyme [Flavobacterium sp.]|jgi:hypothetical protein
MSVAENIQRIKGELPSHVELVAVSKTRPVANLMEAYDAGQRIFGENKILEMTEKQQQMPKDVSWHMIGHVQTNKVKTMAPYVDLVHGVDTFKVLAEINKQALKNNRLINCLLQVHVATEETKFGFNANELEDLLESEEYIALTNIKVKGLMGMATFTEDEDIIRQEFSFLKNLYDHYSERHDFTILSMGMSSDYKIAIECGSNMVRIGSSIFGERNY